MIGKISGLSFDTLTADQKCSLLNRNNLREPVDMQLSLKGKLFLNFFAAFLKCRSNFEHFQKQDDPHS